HGGGWGRSGSTRKLWMKIAAPLQELALARTTHLPQPRALSRPSPHRATVAERGNRENRASRSRPCAHPRQNTSAAQSLDENRLTGSLLCPLRQTYSCALRMATAPPSPILPTAALPGDATYIFLATAV